MRRTFGALRDFFVSLRLTVVLLLLSIILVFAATLDQVHLGVFGVQEKYFHAFLVFSQIGGLTVPTFPGGYLIGGFLIANLLAAHVYRFKFSWRRVGIWLVHGGLILLLVGELVSGLTQHDFQMSIDQGATLGYAESARRAELAVIDETDPAFDDVVAIPDTVLADAHTVQNPKLPFRVVPLAYYPNASFQMRSGSAPGEGPQATMGLGPQIAVTPVPVTTKDDEQNTPAAFVELDGPDGPIGTWVVSTALGMPQRFPYDGRNWRLVMRPQRRYLPFSLTLLKFSHDIYAGTDIPKNFSSRVRINRPDGSAEREVLIYMNNPLRYQGLTFYQQSFKPGDQTSILQVVRNPSWLVPYISCGVIAGGLLIQFLIQLAGFIGRRPSHAKP